MACELVESLEDLQPVIVKWRDHYNIETNWVHKATLERASELIISQCGYYLGEDEYHLIVASCVDVEGGCVGSPYFILKTDVVEWYDLRDPYAK